MTLRAAIIPGAWTGLVVAEVPDDASTPPTIVAVESFEVGHNIGTRAIEDVDLHVACAAALGIVQGAASVAIAWPSVKAPIAARIATALGHALASAGLTVDAVTEWPGRRAQTDAAPFGFAGWPSPSYRVQREAGALLLWRAGRAGPSHTPSMLLGSTAGASDPFTLAGTLALSVLATRAPRFELAPAVLPRPRPCGWPSVRAGIDPGSAALSLVIADGHALPLQLHERHTYEVGQMVPRARPVKRSGPGGVEWLDTHRRVLRDEHVEALAVEVVRACVAAGVELAVIEHGGEWIDSAGSEAAVRRRGTDIARTSWVDGEVGASLRAAGIEVVRVSRSEAFARAVGRTQRDGVMVREAVALRVEGWPADANEHECDAAIAMLSDAMASEAERVEAARSTGRTVTGRGASKGGHAGTSPKLPARRARAMASREACGCDCPRTGPHLSDCLLAVPMLERRAARGCTCPPQTRGRCRKGCPCYVDRPRAVGVSYRCGECGELKRGHVCARGRGEAAE